MFSAVVPSAARGLHGVAYTPLLLGEAMFFIFTCSDDQLLPTLRIMIKNADMGLNI